MIVFVCIIILCCWKRARGQKVRQKHEIKVVQNKIRSHGINNIMCVHNSNSNKMYNVYDYQRTPSPRWYKHAGMVGTAAYTVGR